METKLSIGAATHFVRPFRAPNIAHAFERRDKSDNRTTFRYSTSPIPLGHRAEKFQEKKRWKEQAEHVGPVTPQWSQLVVTGRRVLRLNRRLN